MTIKTRFHHGGHRGCRFFGMIILGIIGAVIFALIFGLAVQYIWNWLVPDLFGLKAITYLQAFALVILAKIFFGGFGRPGHHPRHGGGYKFRMRMTDGKGALPDEALDNPEEFERFWRDEGKASFEKYLKTADTPGGDKETKEG